MREVLIIPERCTGCLSCRLACATAHSQSGSLLAAVAAGERPLSRIAVHRVGGRNYPLNCRHCTDAPCVDACIANAMHTTDEGIVTNHDRWQRCIGCWMCVMACPFGAIRTGGGSEPRAVKCDRQCLQPAPAAPAPARPVPACVRACPTGALVYTTVDEYSEQVQKGFILRLTSGP